MVTRVGFFRATSGRASRDDVPRERILYGQDASTPEVPTYLFSKRQSFDGALRLTFGVLKRGLAPFSYLLNGATSCKPYACC